jgi:outer membrane immunogenic protein
MKKLILSCAVACVAVFPCINKTFAQDSKPRIGIKAGADLMTLGAATFNGLSIIYNYTFGFQGGLYADVPLSSQVSFAPQVLFAQKGGSINTDISVGNTTYTLQGKLHINYLDVPLLMGFKLKPNLTVFVGPQASFFMSQSTNLTTYNGSAGVTQKDNSSQGFRKALIGGNLGVGYNINSNVGINLHYTFDFQHAGEGSTDTGERNRGFALTVGYLF